MSVSEGATEMWLARLYARVPAYYRQLDIELARRQFPGMADDEALGRAPLRSLLRTIAAQVAAVRQGIDDLLDDVVLETADDWVVPYLGELVGTRLLADPVGHSQRQDVRNTVAWRRSKGTPAMLAELARGTTGWGVDVVEGFHTVAWTQHVDHVRQTRTLTPSLRDAVALTAVETAHDPFAHLVDIRLPGRGGHRTGAGTSGGRYHPRSVVFHVRPLEVFRLRGVTPAAADPGHPIPAAARAWTFDPLHREVPLLGGDGLQVDPVAFAADPGAWAGPGRDLSVRRWGVPLALARKNAGGVGLTGGDSAIAAGGGSADGEPVASFGFGAPTPETRLHTTEGLRVLDPTVFSRPAEHVTITALWIPEGGGPPVRLGAVASALLPDHADAYRSDSPLGSAGNLVLRVAAGQPDLGLPGWQALPGPADTCRVPACEIAIRDDSPPRAARHDGVPSTTGRWAGAVIAWLPAVVVRPGQPVDLLLRTDGSTVAVDVSGGAPVVVAGGPARTGEGQAWPPALTGRPASWPYVPGGGVHRFRGARAADQSRFDGHAPLLIEVHVLAGAGQLAGVLLTADTPISDLDPGLRSRLALDPTAGFLMAGTFVASRDAVADRIPGERVTAVALRLSTVTAPAPGAQVPVAPSCEIILTDRAARALLVHLPEADLPVAASAPGSSGDRAWFVVGADGSTWALPAGLQPAPPGGLPDGAVLARVATGQVLPLEGTVPSRRRRLVAGPPVAGELGIDAVRGGFCLAPGDPLLAVGPADLDLGVDLVEAYPAPVGARGVRPAADDVVPPTRVVAVTGDAAVPLPLHRIHRSLGEALAAADAVWAATGAPAEEVVEIVDSASYREDVTVDLGSPDPGGRFGRRHVMVRGGGPEGGSRPCLLGSEGAGPRGPVVSIAGVNGLGAVDALRVDRGLALDGLLVSGQIAVVGGTVRSVRLTGCTLDAGGVQSPPPSFLWMDDDPDHQGELTVVSAVLAGVRAGRGLAMVRLADSVVHRRVGDLRGLAIGGLDAVPRTPQDESVDPGGDRQVRAVSIVRATVIGRIRAGVLDATDALLTGLAVIDSRQEGCLRFSRVEPGSVLPRRYRCVPEDRPADLWDSNAGGLADQAHAAFGSLLPASPLFAVPTDASSPLVLSASEDGDQVGAFAATHPGLRRANLGAKLAEFLPAGLEPVVRPADGQLPLPIRVPST